MSTTEAVKDQLKEKENAYKGNQGYQKFMERYHELLKRGIIKKQEYEIPPMDTIGTRRYQSEGDSE